MITGEFEEFTRVQARDWIEEAGGRVSGSVSRKTRYLLAGQGGGGKLAEAEKYGVEKLNAQQFLQLMNDAGINVQRK